MVMQICLDRDRTLTDVTIARRTFANVVGMSMTSFASEVSTFGSNNVARASRLSVKVQSLFLYLSI